MERSKRDVPPDTNAPPAECFTVLLPTGASVPVREATDQDLEQVVNMTGQQIAQSQQMLQSYYNAMSMYSVANHELGRRRKGGIVVPRTALHS